ncbi:hypothetical protein LNKW23_14290 [Paralimibaculum aggregatum]|uniref:Polyhydroxybutyrate depolymerase n=1 Tax=Paralimibaculum aggregatum TaxID=3036245 RepID=A0ABQ6LFW6_9RHOB|nr:polyhydroxybutyrate depolymerase [Limibaculum sp. NKW23]GMG82216.1 hypothetical protein LNKW23_14290 [Limibaculum sp. NKW23]
MPDRIPTTPRPRGLPGRLAAGLLAAALGLALSAAPAAACGGPEVRCAVAGGEYLLLMPEGAAGPVPALLFLHGWGSSPEGALRRLSGGFRAAAEAGMAVILPEGVPRAGRRPKDWAVRDGRPHPRDDFAFLDTVMADAARRGVARGQVLLSGFSRGGSFVWDIACARPGFAAAYAPLAGAFWEPLPGGCAGPVALHHTHGWTDRVVPLEGRSFRGGAVVQGDVFASLKLMRETLGCAGRQPEEAGTGGRWQRRWLACRNGRLELWLHPGGHGAPPGWMETVIGWFQGLRRASAE